MANQGPSGILQGTIIATLGGIIVLIVQGIFSTAWNSNLQAPLEIISVSMPFNFENSEHFSSFKIDYLSDAINACRLIPAGKNQTFTEARQDEVWNEARPSILKIIKLINKNPGGIQILKLKNKSDSVVENARFVISNAVGVIPPKGATINENDLIINRIDPNQELSITVWLHYPPMGYNKNNINGIINGKSAPISYIVAQREYFVETFFDLFGWTAFVFIIFAFVGAFFSILIPISIYRALSPNFRRWAITKQEFETNLSDVEALYPKFRPDMPNPFFDGTQEK